MRVTRKHRRLRRLRERFSHQWWKWLTVLTLTVLSTLPVGTTFSMYQSHGSPAKASVAAIGASSLEPGPPIDLGLLKPGERVCKGTYIKNLSNRPLELTAEIVPVDPAAQATVSEGRQLEARITPSTLPVGNESAVEVEVVGHVQGPAELQAYVKVTAFNGFITVLIPVTGTVVAPPPVKPPITKPCGTNTAGSNGDCGIEIDPPTSQQRVRPPLVGIDPTPPATQSERPND